jgi:multiple sugar transport system substrate-binding protein
MTRKLGLVISLVAVMVAGAVFTGVSLARPAGTTTITAWVRDYPLDQDSPYKSAKAKFEKLHPGVKIDLLGFPGDVLHQKILLGKAGGPKPDIMQTDTIWLGEFADEGIATNLDSYYATWKDKRDYSPSFLRSSRWKGHYYGVWLNTDVRLMMWNKDVFRKAGLNPDRAPKTWAQLVATAKQIQSRVPDTAGVGINAAASEDTADFWYPLLWMAGGDILNKSWTKATFNSPAGVRALQFYVDLVNKYGVTPKEVITQESSDVEQALFSGSYGIVLSQAGGGFGNYQDVSTAAAFEKKIGNALIPRCPGCPPASGSGGWLLTINSASEQKDLAWEYITMVTDGQNALPFDFAQSVIPVRLSVIRKYKNGIRNYPYSQVVARAYAVTHFRPWVPQYPKFVEQIYTAIEKAVAGKATAKEALDEAAGKVDDILSSG